MSETQYDAVVVGSGFGGSVMTYRLAAAGLRVCLLERGKIFPPGSFPRTPRKIRTNFWDPSEGMYGMYSVWSFKNLEAVVSSGLGGGSLIYANVLLRKDEKWFVREDLQDGGYEYWPITREDLDPHYDNAEQMLDAQPYPFEHAPYDQTPRTREMQEAANRLGLNWQLPPLAVTFRNPGEHPVIGEPIAETYPNLHVRTRYTCRLCGECNIGCNYGSKNTLDYNYLTSAKRAGAEIRTLAEVRSFKPRRQGGYTVHYVEHHPESLEGRKFDTSALPLSSIDTKLLILSAGALGTTYLLLRNRSSFPGISPTLGSRFSGNGDLLGLAIDSQSKTDGKREPRYLDPGVGPAITSAIRVPDISDGGGNRGHYIQDAGYPEHLNWVIESQNRPGFSRRVVRFITRRVRERLRGSLESDVSAEIAGLFGEDFKSATSMPLLGMGRDVPDGRMGLNDGGRLNLEWKVGRSRPFFDAVVRSMREIADELGARFVLNPGYRLGRVVTVHPLGGCPMGRNPLEGVVDASGEVFGYPGFYIADGSVMPGPVGPNPSLTIAAVADRIAEGIIDRHPRRRSR